MTKKRRHLSAYGLLGVLWGTVWLAAGCTTGTLTYQGQVVAAANRTQLSKGGPHRNLWQTEDLTMQYQYSKYADTFDLSGVITFENRLTYSFRALAHFYLTVYFTDAEARIIAAQTLATAAYLQGFTDIAFRRTIALPPGVDAMAFGYTGAAVEDNGDGGPLRKSRGADWSFWKSPVR